MSEKIILDNVNYIASYVDWKQCPTDGLPQYAFVGRSNVGKSSLINMLTGRKKIAHTSKSPGKTRAINFFTVNDEWYIVDLPGYGYAKTSRKIRQKWQNMVLDYLELSQSLVCTFVLVDSRIPPQEKDINFMKHLAERNVPFAIIYTKTDKLKLKKLNENIRRIQDEFLKYWEFMPEEFISSSVSGEGREKILRFIHDLNKKL